MNFILIFLMICFGLICFISGFLNGYRSHKRVFLLKLNDLDSDLLVWPKEIIKLLD